MKLFHTDVTADHTIDARIFENGAKHTVSFVLDDDHNPVRLTGDQFVALINAVAMVGHEALMKAASDLYASRNGMTKGGASIADILPDHGAGTPDHSRG